MDIHGKISFKSFHLSRDSKVSKKKSRRAKRPLALYNPKQQILPETQRIKRFSVQIGLRIYKVQVYHNHNSEVLTSDSGPADLLNFVKVCCSAFSTNQLDDGTSKVVRFEPKPDCTNGAHGLLKYGKYGYGSQVEDRTSGIIQHTRTVDQADTIPLYYRFWFAPGKSYGLLALQSFGGNSCVDIVNRALVEAHKQMYEDWQLTMAKVMPNDVKLYGDKDVRSIQMVARNTDQNLIEKALRPTDSETKIDLEFSLRAKGKGSFGKLKDINKKIADHLEIGGMGFSGAYASVKVGSSFKKIGIIGVSSTAGVIDLTDDVVLDANKHPTFDSISNVTHVQIIDFARLLK
ncbi:hypothetical protein OU789_16745 [Halocynthiibacter sp. C4]|uniref:hypothetical protein n=1 Tax=Halocynthiibacter sp. C4 TaxID=2992758 RepID=UPI00237BD796|nr:hypothetical protein [Halocynthiibacter sp. C4]MDE0591589.1 hypothetical protein [Halocynthiibacter sp. C4]